MSDEEAISVETEIPTPDQIDAPAPRKSTKKAKEVVFARPPFASELLNEDSRKKFDDLPGWQRHLIKQLIAHGNLGRAAKEAGVSRHVSDEVSIKTSEEISMRQAFEAAEITPARIAAELMDCLSAQTIRFDKHGNPHKYTDHRVKLKTIEVICQLRGDFVHQKIEEDKTKGILEMFPKDTDEE